MRLDDISDMARSDRVGMKTPGEAPGAGSGRSDDGQGIEVQEEDGGSLYRTRRPPSTAAMCPFRTQVSLLHRSGSKRSLQGSGHPISCFFNIPRSRACSQTFSSFPSICTEHVHSLFVIYFCTLFYHLSRYSPNLAIDKHQNTIITSTSPRQL